MLPSRTEWASAYSPRTLFQDVAEGVRVPTLPAGARALPEVSAALRRSRVATGVATASGAAGNVGDGKTLRDWVLDARPGSPVEQP